MEQIVRRAGVGTDPRQRGIDLAFEEAVELLGVEPQTLGIGLQLLLLYA